MALRTRLTAGLPFRSVDTAPRLPLTIHKYRPFEEPKQTAFVRSWRWFGDHPSDPRGEAHTSLDNQPHIALSFQLSVPGASREKDFLRSDAYGENIRKLELEGMIQRVAVTIFSAAPPLCRLVRYRMSPSPSRL